MFFYFAGMRHGACTDGSTWSKPWTNYFRWAVTFERRVFSLIRGSDGPDWFGHGACTDGSTWSKPLTKSFSAEQWPLKEEFSLWFEGLTVLIGFGHWLANIKATPGTYMRNMAILDSITGEVTDFTVKCMTAEVYRAVKGVPLRIIYFSRRCQTWM